MKSLCNRCKRASSLTLIKGEMLCDHCSPMKSMNDYHKKLVHLKNLKDIKPTDTKANLTKQSSKMSSGKTLTIKQPQEASSSVERAKQVAKLMKTVAKKK